MSYEACIIGGTGIGSRLLALPGHPVHIPTSLGMVRARAVDLSGREVLVLGRHSAGHKVPPHAVPYEAMALALHSVGAKVCLATAAVGSLRKEWGPGTMVACTDFLDLTGRHTTLFRRSVHHVDFSQPFPAASALVEGGRQVGEAVHQPAVYLCANGPRYETPREIEVFAKLGADVVGMTAASEAIAMREAGVPYACLSIVTNFAAGISDEVLDHGDVVAEMNRSGERALRILDAALGVALA